jgi:hypothetical protein
MTETIDRVASPIAIERTDDRRYERFAYSTRYSDEIVKLSQVRAEQNIVKGELVADIDRNGLINPIDVGVVSEELLIAYLKFVKDTWGASAEISDFEGLRQADSTYSLLLAGHSRHQAIEDLEDRYFLETGVMERHPIPVKIHEIDSIWDIIRIQLGENIHSQPPKERQAIALVEAFEFGNWASIEEFIEDQAKDVTKGFMEKAIRFRELPPEIRSYVLSGPVPYYAGVELAVTVEPLKKYYAAKTGTTAEDLSKDSQSIDMLVRQEFTILCNRIVEGRMNSTAAQAFVKGRRKYWNDATAVMINAPSNENTLTFDLIPEGLDRYIKEKSSEIARQLDAIRRLKHGDIQTLTKLAEGTVSHDKIIAQLERETADAESAAENGRKVLLGAKARQGVEIAGLFDIVSTSQVD